MKRQILLPVLPAENDDKRVIASPTTSRNIVALSQLFSAYGYKLVLGVMDDAPLSDELLQSEDCRELLNNAVNINVLSSEDYEDYAALLIATENHFFELSEIDSVEALQTAIGHFYTHNKLVAVQNPAGLQVINPKLLNRLADGVEVEKGLLPLHAGHNRYVNLMIELISLQMNDLMNGNEHLDERLHKALSAIGPKSTQH